jgi:DNA-binding transcriptional regulator YdaS (Cro superfamily)
MDPVLRRVIEIAGGTAALAQLLGIQAPSIYSWRRVPPNRVKAVAAATGLTPHQLRPDLWDPPPIPAPIPPANLNGEPKRRARKVA